ncbi:MAG: LPS assembly lipoprotein LptE [Myxococcota bacterium]
MPRWPRAVRLLAVLLLAALAACGYHSTLGPASRADAGRGDATRAGAEPARVAVIALRSDSPEPWLDRIVTDALRREVGGRARLVLTENPSNAALQLRGRIRPLDIASRSFSSFVAALEYSLTLALDLEVRLANGDVVKLDPAMLSETDSYLASPDIEVTRTNRLEALRRMSDLLATRVADAIELLDRPAEAPPTGPAAAERAGG